MTHPTDISPLTRVVARLDRASVGDVDPGIVPTRFPSIDRAIGGGFRRGDLIDDEFAAQRIDRVQHAHLALRVPPQLRDAIELGDFLGVSIRELVHFS